MSENYRTTFPPIRNLGCVPNRCDLDQGQSNYITSQEQGKDTMVPLMSL